MTVPGAKHPPGAELDHEGEDDVANTRGRWSRPVRALLAVLMISASGAVGALQVRAAMYAPTRELPVYVFGQPVPAGELDARWLARNARAFLAAPLAVDVAEASREVLPVELGVSVDLPRLQDWIERARDTTSTIHRLQARVTRQDRLDVPIPTRVDPAVALSWFKELGEEVQRAPRDARLDPGNGQVLDHELGLAMNSESSLDALESALFQGRRRFSASLTVTEPRRSRQSIEGLKVGAPLGSFTTPYNQSRPHRDRTANLRRAARSLRGRVLQPGEVLDFNAAVGERSLARGFRMAPVIAEGQITQGVGGGTCQVAGTLHAAALFAGLAIDERRPHSRPSGYIKLGLDAVVAWPRLNLRIRNDRAQAVLIDVTVRAGRVRARILGEGPRRQVSFIRRVEDFLPFTELERPDPSLPRGVRVLAQRGVPGFRVARFRVVQNMESRHGTRERNVDAYPSTTQVWRLGTGDALPPGEDFARPSAAADRSREYLADEFLKMTQGPDIDGTQQHRRPGRTGSPGWTVREGMSGVDPT